MGTIKIKGDTSGYGGNKFNKKIRIQTNDPKNKELVFSLFGNVELIFAMHPRHAKIKGAAGSTQKVVINIVPEKKYEFKILSAQAEKGEHIKFQLKDVIRDKQTAYQLTVENTVMKKGRYFDTIELKTDSEFRPEISVWVFVDLKG